MTQVVYDRLLAELGVPQRSQKISNPNDPSNVIVAFWEPIWDRTLEDCVYANPKGSLTFITLNRIEANLEYISEMLRAMGHVPPTILRSPSWGRTEYVKEGDLERIRQNYLYVKGIIKSRLDPRQLAAFAVVWFTDINILEQLAWEAEQVLTTIENVWVRSAQMLSFCGYTVYLPTQRRQVYTADGLPVYTADGLPVYVL
jgi:hypothetical protein